MPMHAVVGHLVVVFAPMTAVLAAVYALRPGTRRSLRGPLVAAAGTTSVLTVWAGEIGSTLLDRVRERGTPAEYAAAHAHAKGSDALTVAVVVLLVVVLASVWRSLRPGRVPDRSARIASVLLVAAAVAVVVTTGTTLLSALDAVWNHHPSWSALL